MIYAENWKRYQELEGQRDRAAAELQAANANALIAYGQPNQPQAEYLAVQKRVEFEVASNALTSFEANLQATAPEQLQKIQEGRDPSGIAEQTKGYLQSDQAINHLTLLTDVLEATVIDNPTPISTREVLEAAKVALEHGPDYVKAQLAHAEQERNKAIDQQIKDGPRPSLDNKVENAVLDEIAKKDQAAQNQKQLDDLKEKHAEQLQKQTELLDKFKEASEGKSPEFQAQQAEKAEQLRAELKQQQDREMQAAREALERSEQAAREAEIRAQMLENQRDMLR